MYSHVSDHSAASHAVQVLRFFVGAAPRALTESEDAERSVNIIIGGLLTNQELICQRPGSEALWCQRRSIIGYLLQILRTIRGNLITAAAHSDLSVLKVIDWSFKITSIDCTYPVDDYVEVLSSDVKESLPSLHFNSVDSIHQDIESFLVQFIAAEYSFCCKCCNASDAWNYEAQKKYAHRYILFLLILVSTIGNIYV